MKICTKCKVPKSLDSFHKDKTKKGGLRPQCKSCVRKYTKTHPGKGNYHYDPIRDCEKQLIYKYSLTLKDYNQMVKQQNGVCAICGRPEVCKRNDKIRRLTVDHDHITGKIRGLLCALCNTRLGILENRSFVEKAIKYLRN